MLCDVCVCVCVCVCMWVWVGGRCVLSSWEYEDRQIQEKMMDQSPCGSLEKHTRIEKEKERRMEKEGKRHLKDES